MIKIVLNGCNGKMGKVIAELLKDSAEAKIVAGVDISHSVADFPIYTNINSVNEKCDVIIDFSNPECLENVLNFAKLAKCAVVIATTGLSSAQKEYISSCSNDIPVFYSANMSLGVNLLVFLAKKANEVLGMDFDVEIIEKHHNQKIDSPSGTALMIADEINKSNNYRYEYDRHSKRQKRDKNEIGIHSIRGGTIVGEHDVIFAGSDETVTLSHNAASRSVFAKGAIKAAEFVAGKPAGLYDMNDIFNA